MLRLSQSLTRMVCLQLCRFTIESYQSTCSTAARVGFEKTTYNGTEAEEVINVFVAVLGGTLSQEVVVRIYTMDSTARCKLSFGKFSTVVVKSCHPSAPEDYEPLNRTLTFSSTITRLMIPVRIVNDDIDEENEQLVSRLQLEPVGGDLPNVQVDPAQATLIVVDDDSKQML